MLRGAEILMAAAAGFEQGDLGFRLAARPLAARPRRVRSAASEPSKSPWDARNRASTSNASSRSGASSAARSYARIAASGSPKASSSRPHSSSLSSGICERDERHSKSQRLSLCRAVPSSPEMNASNARTASSDPKASISAR